MSKSKIDGYKELLEDIDKALNYISNINTNINKSNLSKMSSKAENIKNNLEKKYKNLDSQK